MSHCEYNVTAYPLSHILNLGFHKMMNSNNDEITNNDSYDVTPIVIRPVAEQSLTQGSISFNSDNLFSSTVNNLNDSFTLCDLDKNNEVTDASTSEVTDASANLFSDDTRNNENLNDFSSFAEPEVANAFEADAPRINCDVDESTDTSFDLPRPSAPRPSAPSSDGAQAEVANASQADAPRIDDSHEDDSYESTDTSFDLPRPSAPKKRRINLGENIQNASVASDIFNRSIQIDTKCLELGKNQKKGLSLTVKWGGYLRIMTIAPAGVGKKAIRWRCSQRSCHGTLLTKIPSYLIKIKDNDSQRKRFELVDADKLEIVHLDPQKETPHTCEQVLDKTVIINRIENEARRIISVKSQESKDSARRLAPQRVIREATKTVVDSLDQEELSRNRLNVDRFNMPRRVHRLIKMVKPTHNDITKDNITSYILPETLSEGSFKLDSQFAEKTSNGMLLFTCPEITWLTDDDATILFDGTWIIKQTPTSTYAQLWIIYGCCKVGSQIIGYAFMENKLKISYKSILLRIKDQLGQLKVHTVIMDGEAAMNSAVTEIIQHQNHENCIFHKITNWRHRLTNKLGHLMPSGRTRPSCTDSKNLFCIWKQIKLVVYFPHQFGILYLSFLSSVLAEQSWEDQEAQMDLVQILEKIQKDFADHPQISWWNALNSAAGPVWADCTTNRIERTNLDIRNHISNFCPNDHKQIEVIITMHEYANYIRSEALIFDTNSVGRKPSKNMKERRSNIDKILAILKLNDQSLARQKEIFNLIDSLNFY